jgi:hypothetical protein
MKECKGCQQVLQKSEFYGDGKYLSTLCKECTKEKRKEHYRKNNVLIQERVARYREKNKEVVLAKGRAYAKIPEVAERRRQNYQKNIEKHRKNDRERHRKYWIRRRLSQIKSRCSKNNIEFDLTEKWVIDQLNNQDWKCYWSGIPLNVDSKLHAPSFDRVTAGGSYTQDNVVMSCFFVNIGRSNAEYGELLNILQEIQISMADKDMEE